VEEFSVDPVALGGLPILLDRLGDDARASRAYLLNHTDLRNGEGFFNLILGGHRKAVDRTTRFLDLLAEPIASGNAARVRAAMRYYTRTDAKAAAALDATLPGGGRFAQISVDPDGLPTGFSDRGEPTQTLNAPPDYSAHYPYHPKWTDLVSPTSYARAAVWLVTDLGTKLGLCDRPYDPFEEFVRPWVGDWGGLRACADVFENLAIACMRMSVNVNAGAHSAQAVWTGNAANGCRDILLALQDSIAGAHCQLSALGAEYRDAAQETYRLAEAVEGLLVEAVDLAIMAALEAATAAATVETIVGPVVMGGALAVTIWQIFVKLHDAVGVTKTAHDLAAIVDSALEGFNVIDPRRPMPALPAGMPDLPS
jgi:hypothetical protein